MRGMLETIFIILTALFIILFIRTVQLEQTNNQQLFIKGKVPQNFPDGFYKGKISMRTTWMGKKFDAKNSSGINIINQKKQYPFKLYKGRGLRDKNLEVIKLDYNLSLNPWLLRMVVDEIVEVKKDHYLGKAHLNILPGFPFTVGFFELKK